MRAPIFIHLQVTETTTELDYSSCYYESDTPSIYVDSVSTKQVSLAEVVKNLSKEQLEELGLQKITKAKR